MPSVFVKLLGDFEAHFAAGQHLDIASKKTRALVAYLALPAGRAHSRAKLVGLLWSDRSEEQARNSLRQALSDLAHALATVEPSPLVKRRDTLALDAAAVEVDVVLFEKLAASEEVSDLRRAAALYRGDLLEGFSVRDPAFEEWLTIERQRLRALVMSVLRKLVAHESGPSAIVIAQRLLTLDPLQEESHRALMLLHADVGEIGLALRQYEACRDTLRRELGTMPSLETESLHREIRQRAKEPVVQGIRCSTASGEVSRSAGAGSETPECPSIAVLPFRNLSGDPRQEYFSDGMTEDLITQLSRTPGLFVIARHSSFAYKEHSGDVREIARELGVRYVVEGSARLVCGRVRINAQLIDAIEGRHLWAERFDRSLDDVFAVQDEVISTIVQALSGRLRTGHTLPRRRTTSLDAYDLFARGRWLAMLSPEDSKAARQLLRKAIELDPGFAEAHAWLAMTHHFAWVYCEQAMEEHRARAHAGARDAVSLDPDNADAHIVLGVVRAYGGELAEGVAEFEMGLRINPDHAAGWNMLADLRVLEGRAAEGIDCARHSFRCDPHPPGDYYWPLGFAQYAAGRYQDAVGTLRHDSARGPGARRIVAASLAQLGRMTEAREEARKFLLEFPQFSAAEWGRTQPFRNASDRQHFIDGYVKAGLPR
jgi:TolB-like protein